MKMSKAQARLQAGSARGVLRAKPGSCRRQAVLARGEGVQEKQLFGEDFGARDPYAAEVESNFCEKVLGNYDTEHVIKAPEAIGKLLGLTAKSCSAEHAEPLSEKERERLRNQVPGWRVSSNDAGGLCLRYDWTAQDAEMAAQLQERVASVATAEEHSMDVSVSDVFVSAALNQQGTEDLSLNDFIVAAKVNELELASLLKKKRAKFWA